ncbi:MAG: hypothetical protein ABEJ58_02950 [Halodesulfurarchaeum sp.]
MYPPSRKNIPVAADLAKPIGPFYSPSTARDVPFQTKQVRRADGTTKYRRVVPSPRPTEIVESREIEALLEDGSLVITVGGGGIPVVSENGDLRGVEAVIDKDRASSVLASEIGADVLLVLTDVECAYLGFGGPDPEPLGRVSTDEMREYLEDDQFAEGSMGPKVEASIEFVESDGTRAIITTVDNVEAALAGETGTQMYQA